MLKVGLVGCGGISGAHVPGWQKLDDCELVAICDVRPEMMDKYPGPRRYLDFDEMLEKEELDILDICLPTYLHADFSVKAMEKGINVICEKPISLNRNDVERVYGCAKEHGVKFMIAQVLRFWPEYEKIKEFYDNKTYGKLLSGYMKRLGNCPQWSWDNWMKDEKRSGYVPFDLHIHDLDYMVYAFGKPSNTICHRSKRDSQDYLVATYEYDGFFITAESSWYGAPHPFKSGFRFEFEEAVVVKDEQGLIVYENNGKIFNLTGNEQASDVINLPQSDAYANEIEYFRDCVVNNKPADKVKADELGAVLDILTEF